MSEYEHFTAYSALSNAAANLRFRDMNRAVLISVAALCVSAAPLALILSGDISDPIAAEGLRQTLSMKKVHIHLKVLLSKRVKCESISRNPFEV